MSNTDTIRQLNAKIRQLQRPQSKPDSEFHGTRTGIKAFDALLPAGGLSGGTLIEWLSPQGGGGSTLAMALAAQLLRSGNSSSTLVVIDSNQEFYPPAITNPGVSLSQVVIIRPGHIGEAIWAFEQSLRCSGITITMAWIDHLTDQTFRRLQLATESGGGVGFLFRPPRMRKQRSWADARFLVEPASAPQAFESGWGSRKSVPGVPRFTSTPTSAPVNKKGGSLVFEAPSRPFQNETSDPSIRVRRLQVQLLHCRGRIEGGQVELEINDETGDVHLASRLASPTTGPRKTRA